MQNSMNAADCFRGKRLLSRRRMKQLVIKLLNDGRCQLIQAVLPQMRQDVQSNILSIEVCGGCFDAFQILVLPSFQPCLQKKRGGLFLCDRLDPAASDFGNYFFARRACKGFRDLLFCVWIVKERDAPFPILVNWTILSFSFFFFFITFIISFNNDYLFIFIKIIRS